MVRKTILREGALWNPKLLEVSLRLCSSFSFSSFPRSFSTFYLVQQTVYSSSVDIRPEWTVKEQIPFTSLSKLNYKVDEPEELKFCGKLRYYDKAYDRITPRSEKPLLRTKRTFRSVTTSDDPVIRCVLSSILSWSPWGSFKCFWKYRSIQMRFVILWIQESICACFALSSSCTIDCIGLAFQNWWLIGSFWFQMMLCRAHFWMHGWDKTELTVYCMGCWCTSQLLLAEVANPFCHWMDREVEVKCLSGNKHDIQS